MNTTTDDTIDQGLPETEQDAQHSAGSRIKRLFRFLWMGPTPNPEDRAGPRFRRLFWFLLAAAVVWATYDALMLALGGRNPAYGSGLQQWNYARWIMAPSDLEDYLFDSLGLFLMARVIPVMFAAGTCSLIFMAKTYYATPDSTRRSLLVQASVYQLVGLVVIMSLQDRLRFWWSTSHTVIPTLTLRVFQFGTVMVWFAFPFLIYWLAMPVIQWDQERHKMQDSRVPRKFRSGWSWLATDQEQLQQAPPVEVVCDYDEKEEKAKRLAARKRALRPSVMATIVLCLALSLLRVLTAGPATNTEGTWTKLPLNGGTVSSIVIDPRASSILYAGTETSGIFRSMDSGTTWSAANSGLTELSIRSLVINPVAPSTLYAVTSSGIFRSTDNGEMWTAANTGLANEYGNIAYVTNLAVNPVDPSILYACAANTVFRSTDAGTTWTTTGLADNWFNCLAIDPITPSIVYAGSISYASPQSASVFRSTDAGTTWTQVNTGLTNTNIQHLVIDPLTPSTLYANSDGGLFRSTDRGNAWTPVSTGIADGDLWSLVINPATPSILYGCTSNGVVRSIDSGITWTATGLANHDIHSLTIDPLNPSTLYTSTDAGVFRSTDSGVVWTEASAGLNVSRSVGCIAVDPLTSSTIYADTYDGMFCSTDSGKTWTPTSAGGTNIDVRALAVDPVTPSILYVGTQANGIFRSADSGKTWTATGLTDMEVLSLAVDPVNPSILYAGVEKSSPEGILRSTDGGKTWSQANTGLTDKILDRKSTSLALIFGLAIDPANPSTLYACSVIDGIFRSTDSGMTWILQDTGTARMSVQALAVDPRNPGTLYAETDSGVLRSANNGRTWIPLGTGIESMQIRGLAIDPVNPTILYAGTKGGIFRYDLTPFAE